MYRNCLTLLLPLMNVFGPFLLAMLQQDGRSNRTPVIGPAARCIAGKRFPCRLVIWHATSVSFLHGLCGFKWGPLKQSQQQNSSWRMLEGSNMRLWFCLLLGCNQLENHIPSWVSQFLWASYLLQSTKFVYCISTISVSEPICVSKKLSDVPVGPKLCYTLIHMYNVYVYIYIYIYIFNDMCIL